MQLINNLNLILTQISMKDITNDKYGNLQIIKKIGDLTYVFKNYKELNDNYFYLHTAYKK